jgi:membrane associated rhomboid family serine protease
MGEADRYIDYKHPRKKILLGADNNALVALFAINVIFFLTLLTMQVVYFFFQQDKSLFASHVVQYFILPAKITTLIERPWTILSFMFSHTLVLHILSNMLWLWAFGYILQQMTGNRKLIPIYIYGGLVGALFFILANYFIPPLKPFIEISYLEGGNASTMAVAVATTMLAPNFRFFRNLNGGIPIWVLTGIYILIDIAGVATFSAAESLAHLGGAFAGFLFVYFLKRGKDTGEWMSQVYEWFMNLFNPDKKYNRNKNVKEKIFYNTEGRKPYQKQAVVNQQKIDQILDKINQKGFQFLSDEEKMILKKAAEEDL